MDIPVESCLHCCSDCHNLFPDYAAFLEHQTECRGNLSDQVTIQICTDPAEAGIVVNDQGEIVVNDQGEIVINDQGEIVVNDQGEIVVNDQDVVVNDQTASQEDLEEVQEVLDSTNTYSIVELVEEPKIANATNIGKRKRGRPTTLERVKSQKTNTMFIEMIKLPPNTENVIQKNETTVLQIPSSNSGDNSNGNAIAQDDSNMNNESGIDNSSNATGNDGAFNDFVADNSTDDSVAVLDNVVQTVEITECDESSILVQHEDAKLMNLHHSIRLESNRTRYTPRSDTPKASDYKVVVENHLEVYHCSYCPYKTKHMNMLGRHLTGHNENGEPFQCDKCRFKSLFRGAFHAHLKKHEHVLKCDHCSYTCRDGRDLSRHKLRHTGEMPFQCDHCDKKFRQKHCLDMHLRTHTGDVFKCEFDNCSYETPNPYLLKSHRQRRHNVEELPTYLCNCGYSTQDKSSFNHHQKTHLGLKDHKCPYCPYTAVKSNEVKRHMKSHMEEKYYQCIQCQFKTAHATALRNHLMGHENFKPYSCSICSYSHRSKSRIQQHFESQHPGQDIVILSQDRRFSIDLDQYKCNNGVEISRDSVIKLKYSTQEKEAITVDENEGTFQISLVKELVVNSEDASDSLGGATFQCPKCSFTCFSGAALSSHSIQCHEEHEFCGEDRMVADEGLMAALASVQAQMDVVTS